MYKIFLSLFNAVVFNESLLSLLFFTIPLSVHLPRPIFPSPRQCKKWIFNITQFETDINQKFSIDVYGCTMPWFRFGSCRHIYQYIHLIKTLSVKRLIKYLYHKNFQYKEIFSINTFVPYSLTTLFDYIKYCLPSKTRTYFPTLSHSRN